MQKKVVSPDAGIAYCALQSWILQTAVSCMNCMEINFISVQCIRDPQSNFVIIIFHTIMRGSYLAKDSICLLLPLAVIWKKVLNHNVKDFPNPEVNGHSNNCYLCILLPKTSEALATSANSERHMPKHVLIVAYWQEHDDGFGTISP